MVAAVMGAPMEAMPTALVRRSGKRSADAGGGIGRSATAGSWRGATDGGWYAKRSADSRSAWAHWRATMGRVMRSMPYTSASGPRGCMDPVRLRMGAMGRFKLFDSP